MIQHATIRRLVPPAKATWDFAFARWSAAHAAAEASGWDDDLTDASIEERAILLHLPAPDVAALHWKLTELYGEAGKDGYGDAVLNDYNAAIVADAARLAKMEG